VEQLSARTARPGHRPEPVVADDSLTTDRDVGASA
jgi:hypothetical protein